MARARRPFNHAHLISLRPCYSQRFLWGQHLGEEDAESVRRAFYALHGDHATGSPDDEPGGSGGGEGTRGGATGVAPGHEHTVREGEGGEGWWRFIVTRVSQALLVVVLFRAWNQEQVEPG